MRQTLLVGTGFMGTNHAKKIVSDDLEAIELSVACDSDVAKLIAFREQFPDVPVYLVPKKDSLSPEDIAAAKAAGIETMDSVAEIVEQFQVNTLVGATNNDSHLDVLKSALSVRNDQNKPIIDLVFQEKPFASSLEEANEAEALFKDGDVTLNLNGILTFSAIWKEFVTKKEDLEGRGYALERVSCAYGKNRMEDTRPATGGWVGLEGIHALDISTVGIGGIDVIDAESEATRGFLAEAANPETGDGVETYAINTKIKARDKRIGRDIHIDLEGSFSYEEQNRKVQYHFIDPASGASAVLELNFDVREGDKRTDKMAILERNDQQQITFEAEYESNTDKLMGYYESALNPESKQPMYDLSRAVAVQRVLEDLSNISNVRELSSRSEYAPRRPMMGTIFKRPKAKPARDRTYKI